MEKVTIEISEEEYESEFAQGLGEDEVLAPGRHTFQRGGFLARHGIESKPTMVPQQRVLLNLDSDVFTYFENRADTADSLRAQINHILRKIMELEQGIS